MQIFDFPYHRVSDEYPESSTTMKFGGGYEFATKPRGPDQMIFKLAFQGMWFYEANGAVDIATNPQINMRRLEMFYEEHRLYEKFEYPHPRRGMRVCRFKKPLITPDGIPGANGLVQSFTIELISQP